MKIILIALLFIGTVVNGQTNMIALRSHSGNLSYFNASAPDNLGMVAEYDFVVDTIVVISDTSAVEFYSYGGPGKIPDTVYFPQYLDTSLTAADRQAYYPNVVFIDDKRPAKTEAEDTLAKHRERIHGRHDVIKNETVPVTPDNDNGPLSPGNFGILNYFVLGLVVVMLITGIFIWFTNRKTVAA